MVMLCISICFIGMPSSTLGDEELPDIGVQSSVLEKLDELLLQLDKLVVSPSPSSSPLSDEFDVQIEQIPAAIGHFTGATGYFPAAYTVAQQADNAAQHINVTHAEDGVTDTPTYQPGTDNYWINMVLTLEPDVETPDDPRLTDELAVSAMMELVDGFFDSIYNSAAQANPLCPYAMHTLDEGVLQSACSAPDKLCTECLPGLVKQFAPIATDSKFVIESMEDVQFFTRECLIPIMPRLIELVPNWSGIGFCQLSAENVRSYLVAEQQLVAEQ